MANDNKGFNNAAKAKKDEFYTQLTDIEKEMRYYRDYFMGKIVFCNCDDPFESNFFKYFAMNFNPLGLKKLIATCYATSPVSGTELEYYVDDDGQLSFVPSENVAPIQAQEERHPYRIEITEVTDENGDGRIDLADVEYLLKNKKNMLTLLDGDGDFRSPECIELMQQADVIVTNPPFSLFRDYVAQLIEYKKDFIIIGNQNSITYKEIFPLIRDGKMWYGASIHSHGRDFRVPDDYPLQAYEFRTDEHGNKYINVKGVRWFTNIDYKERHEDLILYKRYTPEEYPKYDNYDAIEVSKTADIPCDYEGIMGVPISFMDKFSPEQFEIIGLDRYTVPKEFLVGGRVAINGKPKYARILIRRKQVNTNEN
ncbi:adenine-specific methyltransferase EcoRI family protein [Brotaphodocola catenula]|uniref:Adenine-specific methyltransferase EcoRI family protein n=1 Tax=Brotaphodocola catenula TaxID=2885361 RepID=A0AAE3AQD6_9FIRM|nr:adenine-specific methyltransferase EcoRI family protein [Brotaphodocola catenula]MCC2164921.1 adenine-specific methyltransferase EcoRI family protein [Brotaphodocola catenula]